MKHLGLALILIGVLALRVAAQTDYVVGPQDVLTVTVFGEPEMSGKFIVEADGTFVYAQVGRLMASGLTLRAIEQELKTQLADGFLKNPQLTVAIETPRSRRILIMGEVRSPGEYQLAGETSLLSALLRAGGPAPTAGREIVIVRPPTKSAGQSATSSTAPAATAAGDEPKTDDPNEPEILRIDLPALQAGDLSLNIDLHDGDAINLLKALSVFVTGQVRSPGAYAIDRGTTVLQILSLAGGIAERGAEGRLRILRTVNGKKVEVKAKLDDVVEPGDTIVVPERYF